MKFTPAKLATFMAAIAIALFSSCSSDSGSDEQTLEVTGMTITQVNDKLRVTYTTNLQAQTVRLYMGVNGQSGMSMIYEAFSSPFEVPIENTSLSAGQTGFFFLDARQDNMQPSPLFGPIELTIANYCSGPSNHAGLHGHRHIYQNADPSLRRHSSH